MSTSQEQAVRNYRRRLKRRGMKRLELQATEQDASLLKELAKVLRQGDDKSELVRTRIREVVKQPESAKALLAAAPLEGIRITRSTDHGRIVEL